MGRDRRSLPALVTGNLDNLVYFSDHDVIRAGVNYSGGNGGRHTLGAGRGLTKVIVVIEVNGYRIGNLALAQPVAGALATHVTPTSENPGQASLSNRDVVRSEMSSLRVFVPLLSCFS